MNHSVSNNRGPIVACVFLGFLETAGLFFPQLNYITLLLACWMVFTKDDTDTLCILCFLFSFAPIFKAGTGFSFFNIVIAAAIVKMLMRTGIKGAYAGSFLFLALYTMFGCIFQGATGAIFDCITFLAYIMFIALYYYPGKKAFINVLFFVNLGIVFSSVLGLFRDEIPRLQNLISLARVRMEVGDYYYRFSGLETNPNYYTMIISIAIACLAVLIIQRRARLIDYVFMGLLTLFGFMSVSNSFLVTYILTMVLLLIWSGKESKKNIIIVICTMAVVIFVVSIFVGDDLSRALDFRTQSLLGSDDISVATTGRTTLIEGYIDFLMANPLVLLFGKGIGAKNLGIGASHNYYIDMLYNLGIIGTEIYVVCLFRIFKNKMMRPYNLKMYQFLPLITFLVRAMARNLILSEQLVFMLMLCSFAIYDNGNEESYSDIGEYIR